MRSNNRLYDFSALSIKRRIMLLVVMFVLSAQFAQADYYVNFQNGKLYVFPESCLQSMSQQDESVTFVAIDGSVYSYSIDEIESIGTQLNKELPTITSYKFNNKNNYQVISDAVGEITEEEINVVVAGIGKRLTATFSLSDESARAYVDGQEQTSMSSRLRFENSRDYVVGYPGDLVLALQDSGEYEMVPYGRTYTVNVVFLTDHSTSFPRIDINTVGGVNITSKEFYVDAEIIIDGAGVFPSMTDSVKIKGRGNVSWSSNPNSKNPYRLKFANKVKPFGLTKGKNWVLLANKLRGSMLTNAIGMKAASLIGTVAVNHMIPVDLYVNGTYKGSYNFTEKVGFAGNSVDLEDESAAAMLELDQYYDEPETQKFLSTPYGIPVNVKAPDFAEDETLLTLNDIKTRFNEFVDALNEGQDIVNYVDIESLARYLMANNLICNREITDPKSMFCYNENILDPESKFVFGPAWDLDWAYGYDGKTVASYFSNNIEYDYFNKVNGRQFEFFSALGKNPRVVLCFLEYWKKFIENDLDELCEFCQDYYQYVKPSFASNKAAGLDNANYANQSIQAANWIRQRVDFIYSHLILDYGKLGDINVDGKVNINDVATLVSYLLNGDGLVVNKMNMDVNEDGEVNIDDVTRLIEFLLLN